MERTKWPAVTGLVAGTILLCRSIPTTFALDKPVHTSIAVLASCAGAILGFSRLLPRDGGGRSHKGQQYDAVPMGDLGQLNSSREPSPSPEDVRYPSSLRKLRITFLVLVLAICLRVEALREIIANVQCAASSWEPAIPLLFAVLDYVGTQRHAKRATSDDDPESSMYDWLESSWTTARYRYVAATALLAYGAIDGLASASSGRSTFICAATLPFHSLIPLLQRMGTLLDVVILYCIEQLLRQQEGRGQRSLVLRFTSVGWAFLFSAGVTLIAGLVYYTLAEHDRKWVATIPSLYLWGTLRLDALICFTVVCTIICVSGYDYVSG